MSDKDRVARLLDLQEKLCYGSITDDEREELNNITSPGDATDAQKDYIVTLLDTTGTSLSDYTDDADVTVDDLSFDDASEIIDALKEVEDDYYKELRGLRGY